MYLGHAPIIIQSMSLAVPIVAEAFASVENIDKPVSFLSFFGAIFALAGNFKIQQGDRKRRFLRIKEIEKEQEAELQMREL